MATLYDTLVSQGVQPRDTYNTQKQLYEKLGSPLGSYQGSYQQNIWLLSQLGGKNYKDILNPPQQQQQQQQPISQPQISAPSPPPAPPIPTAEENAKAILAQSAQLYQDAFNRFTQYQKTNPWAFDDVLKQKTLEAKEQIDPYYNETMANYLLGVQRKRERSSQDTNQLLSEISAQNQSYTRDTENKLSLALDKARQGFAESGLFDSGQRYRSEGLLGIESQNSLNDILRGQTFRSQAKQQELSRNLQDIALDKDIYQREQARSELVDVSQRAANLTKESGQRYSAGFQATLPPALQANTGFDILKQIGIYR